MVRKDKRQMSLLDATDSYEHNGATSVKNDHSKPKVPQNKNSSLQNADPRVLAIALEKKQDEVTRLQMEIKRYGDQLSVSNDLTRGSYITLTLVFGMTLVLLYAVYANYRANTKIDHQYQFVTNQIRSAFRGDAVAHSEIVQRIPELTRRRLPRALNANGGESFKPLPTFKDEVGNTVSLGGLKIETQVAVYSAPHDNSFVFGYLKDDSDVVSVDRYGENGEWSKLMLSTGFPVWISKNYVTQIDETLGKVREENINFRNLPGNRSKIIGQVTKGDLVQIIGSDQDWYRIMTPADFTMWVKSQQFKLLIE